MKLSRAPENLAVPSEAGKAAPEGAGKAAGAGGVAVARRRGLAGFLIFGAVPSAALLSGGGGAASTLGYSLGGLFLGSVVYWFFGGKWGARSRLREVCLAVLMVLWLGLGLVFPRGSTFSFWQFLAVVAAAPLFPISLLSLGWVAGFAIAGWMMSGAALGGVGWQGASALACAGLFAGAALKYRTLREGAVLDLERENRGLRERLEGGEGRVQSAEEAIRLVSDATSAGVILHEKGVIRSASETCFSLFGYGAGEFEGKPVLELFTESSRPRVEEMIQGGVQNAMEGEGLTKTGGAIFLDVSNAVILAGNSSRMLMTVQNAAIRKELEDLRFEAKRREERMRERQSALAELELVIDKPGQIVPVLVRINRVAATLLRPSGGACLVLSKDAGASFTVGDSTVPGLLPQVSFPAGTPLGKATFWILERPETFVVDSAHSDPFYLNRMFSELQVNSYMATPLRREGQGLGVLFVLEKGHRSFSGDDIELLETLASRAAVAMARTVVYEELWASNQLLETKTLDLEESNRELCIAQERLATANEALGSTNERLQRQSDELRAMNGELLRAKDSAERANRVKSEFLQVMSHELRTPLSGILGMANLLVYTNMDQKQQDYVDTLRQSADSLLRSIDDILDFTQLQPGQATFERQVFDLHEMVGRTVESLAPSAREKKLGIFCSLMPDVPAEVRGDPNRLGQVLRKLLENAIKFTDEGHVALSAHLEKEEEDRAEVSFRVSDTGIGIGVGARERIFEPFNQGNTSSTRRHGGTGMGLPLCKRLAELMGGEISFESTPGKGSIFVLKLKLEKHEAKGGAAGERWEGGARRGEKALVVESNLGFRGLLTDQLEAMGMRVTSVDFPVECIKILVEAAGQGAPYSVVFLDAGIEHPSAVTLNRLVKAGPATRGTKVVLLTPHQEAEADFSDFRLLADARLPKFLLGRNLASCVRQALGDGDLEFAGGLPRAAEAPVSL